MYVMNWLAYKKNQKQVINCWSERKGEQKIVEVGQRKYDWVVYYHSEWVKGKKVPT